MVLTEMSTIVRFYSREQCKQITINMEKKKKISVALLIVAVLSHVPYITGTWDILYSQIIGIPALVVYGAVQDFMKK